MKQLTTRLRLGRDTLWVVPSVHHRIAFAEQVNHICGSEGPDAIAVELGPQTTGAVATWMAELGVSPKERKNLPCMLGLTKTNRRVHPAVRGAAQRLQELTGRELQDLSPDLLREALGYSSVRVLYLSPTDSIIEAIRCALELDIPLYGVDLEETADRHRRTTMLQDPTAAHGAVDLYVEQNAEWAEHQRDDQIDKRREEAMAARLKRICDRHRRVLFVCGLAHWKPLQTFLADPGVQGAPAAEAREVEAVGFRRVVVHPLLAIHYMDLFPAFAEIYQRHRPHARQHRTWSVRDNLDAAALFRDMLHSTYERHFVGRGREEQLERSFEDWAAHGDFERLLGHLCVVRQRKVPDLFTALECAQGVMTPAFCETLARTLMDFDWVKPDEFPDELILVPAPTDTGRPQRAGYLDHRGRRSRHFHIGALPGPEGLTVRVPIPWDWADEPPPPPPPTTGQQSSWFPIDYLGTAMSLQAIQIARTEHNSPRPVRFEGSLLGGVDLRTSIRAEIRGDDQLYVRDLARARRQGSAEDDGFPVVWIFRVAEAAGSHWHVWSDSLTEYQPHLRRAASLEEARQRFGSSMVTIVCRSCSRVDERLSCPGCMVTRYDLSGLVAFHPSIFTVKQAARWGEATHWMRNPVVGRGSFNPSTFSGLAGTYKSRFGLDLQAHDWIGALVLTAIPYSAGTVTVIAPDGLELADAVHRQATRQGVGIRQLPHSYYPAENVRRIASLIMIPNLGRTPADDMPIYPEHVERLLGQKPDANRDLVPSSWLNYGLDNDEIVR